MSSVTDRGHTCLETLFLLGRLNRRNEAVSVEIAGREACFRVTDRIVSS